MKKLLAYLLFLTTFSSFVIITKVEASNKENYFVVTAYYSPLSDQKYYSYSVYTGRERTFKEEKRLQGEGIRGASGKGVFSGMLAAPKNYAFGTKIKLEGLGIGEVSDRGGAIVNKGTRGYGYDRIDVWMGYGYEGLRRATYWGKRTIKGEIISKKSEVNLDYKIIASPKWVITNKKHIPKIQNKVSIFKRNLTLIAEFKRLQEVLYEMNLYSGKINGDYKTIISSIYDFQLKKKIVKSEYSPGAGTYGPKTRKALGISYNLFLEDKHKEEKRIVKIEEEKQKKIQKEIERVKLLVIKAEKFKLQSEKKVDKIISFIGNPKEGEISYRVRELQLRLKELGYFNYKDTAIFGKITKNSIISYQLDKKIISSKNELGAGIVGPKTKDALKNDLKKQFLKEIVKLEKLDFKKAASIIGNKI